MKTGKIIDIKDAPETFWHIVYSKKKSECQHSKTWMSMMPLDKVSISKKYLRYKIMLTEVCSECGFKRRRKIGIMKEGGIPVPNFKNVYMRDE